MGKLCQLLEISRSGYYAWLRGGKSARKTANQALLRELVRLHEKYPALGLDSLYHMLKPVFHCSRGRVHRLMKAAGIHSQRKRAYKATTNSRHNCPIAPNLLQRQFTFSRPNQAWVGDITYIPTGEGWLYLAIVKDLCTKKIVGYAFSQRIDTQLTLDALNMAVRRERPAPGLIFHSDRGVQYAAAAFRKRLAALGIRQSMSRKGNPYDNAVVESTNRLLKKELVYRNHYTTIEQLRHDLNDYVWWSDNQRLHSTLGYRSPKEFTEQGLVL